MHTSNWPRRLPKFHCNNCYDYYVGHVLSLVKTFFKKVYWDLKCTNCSVPWVMVMVCPDTGKFEITTYISMCQLVVTDHTYGLLYEYMYVHWENNNKDPSTHVHILTCIITTHITKNQIPSLWWLNGILTHLSSAPHYMCVLAHHKAPMLMIYTLWYTALKTMG